MTGGNMTSMRGDETVVFCSATRPVASVAALAGFSRYIVIRAFAFLWMPQPRPGTVEGLGLLQRDFRQRFDEREETFVWLLAIKLKGLVADGVAVAAFHAMLVVVEYLLERAEINHGLISLEAGTLLAFECLHGHGAKLDAFDRSPRFLVTLENLNSVKASVGKCFQKTVFGERAGNAAAPKFGVGLEVLRHFLIGHDVRNYRPPAFPQHAENFGKQQSLRFRLDQI